MTTPPELYSARRSACGGWAAAAIGWFLYGHAHHGAARAWPLAFAALCAAITAMYAIWLVLVALPGQDRP